jgi:lipoprotein-anchoring transpeptidase ErfK/SrfK
MVNLTIMNPPKSLDVLEGQCRACSKVPLFNVFAEIIPPESRYYGEIGQYPKIRPLDVPSIISVSTRFIGTFSFQRTCLHTRDYKGDVMNFQLLAMKSAGLLTAGTALWIGAAIAAPLSTPYPSNSGVPIESVMRGYATEETENPGLAPELQRQVVVYPARVAAGSVIIDTAHTYLYYVLGDGKAIRYGIGVGRDGFIWSGTQAVTRKAEWPDWTPPQEMIGRQPYLPRWMAGGESNPLGARAIYLGSTVYRIHGTNMPETIGHKVSSGCIRMLNADVIDLYNRVDVGTKVIVLPNNNYVATVAAAVVSAHLVAPRSSDPRAPHIYWP